MSVGHTTDNEHIDDSVADLTVQMMRHADAGGVQRLLDAAKDIKARVTGTGDQYVESSALTLEHLVEPILDALGFPAEQRSVEPRRPNVYHLYAQGQPMALLVANALGSTFAGSPGLTNSNPRYQFVRKDSGYPGRIAFTNGINWVVFDSDPEVPPNQFTIYQPEAFWDLFFLGRSNRLQGE